MFYSNIVACLYRFYGKYKNYSPYFASICGTMYCQYAIFILITVVLKKIFNIEVITEYLFNHLYYFLILMIAWALCLSKIYTKEKVDKILYLYDSKKNYEKVIWGLVTLMSIVCPTIMIMLLSVK